jgi:hypothetical protein
MQVTKGTKVAGGVIAGVLLLSGGAMAWAAAAPARPAVVVAAADPTPTTPSTTTPASPAPNAPKAPRGPRAILGLPGLRLGKAVHGTVTVQDQNGNWVEVTFDRGQVTAADATSVTLKRADTPDKPVTIAITPDTKFFGVSGATSLQTGKQALVVSKDGKATFVFQPNPNNPGRPRLRPNNNQNNNGKNNNNNGSPPSTTPAPPATSTPPTTKG